MNFFVFLIFFFGRRIRWPWKRQKHKINLVARLFFFLPWLFLMPELKINNQTKGSTQAKGNQTDEIKRWFSKVTKAHWCETCPWAPLLIPPPLFWSDDACVANILLLLLFFLVSPILLLLLLTSQNAAAAELWNSAVNSHPQAIPPLPLLLARVRIH